MASDENSFKQDRLIEDHLRSGLYIVSTPIGNLGDLSSRALKTLKQADLIACEDTRVTAKLLTAYGVKSRLIAYHEHNGDLQRPKIMDAMDRGEIVALVSDAGTPLISDPGYKLVHEAQEEGYYVTACPGPSAMIMALTLSGMPTDRFLFAGFPPNKSGARQSFYESVKDNQATLVFYESARRLTESLKDAEQILGSRQAAVCRELTKKFEEVKRGPLNELIAYYEEVGNPKGEVVLVIDRAAAQSKAEQIGLDSETLLTKALTYLSVKDASAFVASLTGEKKKDLYKKALEMKDR
ncbi:16S rRNA (cytidine(1402)-2'-O)-methyltransferase [Temperatibacter marinus]|uniref:Ribosomal RNA small subunit methyltransferase I n=1 Tax=Temperatibacter marinus TaxID=1456591 RepID=A0AA52EF42_9PROT|nr:16S rRNA (cytidine(1402)-2'-O)-methyltransferase [Temperatibacter marinus]WND03646.1 16S rRNA (cytidine(1402)-2'-O)-methyltransferase [Temperatibacter marinus]